MFWKTSAINRFLTYGFFSHAITLNALFVEQKPLFEYEMVTVFLFFRCNKNFFHFVSQRKNAAEIQILSSETYSTITRGQKNRRWQLGSKG